MSSIYNNLNNILIVDPNEIINENSIDNATPEIQNIRSSLQFYCISRSKNNVTLDINNKVIRVDNNGTSTRVNFLGFNPDLETGAGYNNTYLTNINSNNRSDDPYGGFGITNVSIKITANLVPEVNITFLDIKSAALRDKNNPYNTLFELPPPIFKLIIKGGYGLYTEYDLHKLDQSITLESNGDSIITAKFIGDRYGVLSDVLLNYVSSVHFFKYKDIIFDKKTESRSFYEFIQKSNILYNNVDKIKTTNPIFTKQQELNNKLALIKELYDEFTIDSNIKPLLYNKLISKDDVISIYSCYNEYKPKDSGNIIEKYLLDDNNISYTTSIASNDKIVLKTIIFKNINNENGEPLRLFLTESYINGYLKKYFEEKYNKDGINIEYRFSLYNDIINNTYEIILHSNTSGVDEILINKVIKLELNINNEINTNNNEITKLAKDISIETVGSEPTIGNIFNFMLGDLDYFLTELKKSGDEAGNRTSVGGYKVYKQVGYPAVTKQATIKGVTREVLVYPGEYEQFKDWSEVKFIDKYINSLYSRNDSDALVDALLTQKTDGSDKYIPIIANEVNNTSLIKNYYFNKKDVSSIFLSLFQRYILLRDYVYAGNFNKNIIEFYAKAEANNIAYALISNKKISDFLLNIKEFSFDNVINNVVNASDIIFKNNEKEIYNYDGQEYFSNGFNKQIIKISNNLNIIDNNLSTDNNIDKLMKNSIDSKKWFTDLIGITKNENIVKDNNNFFINRDKELENSLNKKSDYINNDFLNNNNQIQDFEICDQLDLVIGYFIYLYYKNINNISIKTINIYDFLKNVLDYYNIDDDGFYNKIFSEPKITSYEYKNYFLPFYIELPNIFIYMLDTRYNTGYFSISSDDRTIISNYINESFNNQDLINLNNVTDEFNSLNKYDVNNLYRNQLLINFTKKIKTDNLNAFNKFKEKGYLLVNNINVFTNASTGNKFNSVNYNLENDNTLNEYLKIFFGELQARLKENKINLENRKKELTSLIKDNDLKLEIYKSFKNIYDRWLYNKQYNPFTLLQNNKSVVNNETFKFVDRVYNDISQDSIITYQNLIEDVKNSDTSIWTSISNLLSHNNYNFFPFQSFIPTTTGNFDLEQWKKCFQIDNKYTNENISKPCFICMYVGGFSSLPSPYDDNITNDDNSDSFNLYDIYSDNNLTISSKLPTDFNNLTKNNPVTAFRFSFGQQNQLVFNNISLSTTEFVNTDQSIRAVDSIISRTANSNPLPKGQSLLDVYKNQSYTLGAVINYGNMSIQPTQYLQLDNVPIFNGAYMIFEVEHTIGTNDILETKFKAYRMSRYINNIITDYAFQFFDIDTSNNINNGITVYNPNLTKTNLVDANGKTPRGIRNNNPGNIRFNSKLNYDGKITDINKVDKEFEEFKTMEQGIAAMYTLLHNNYITKGYNTIESIIPKYAPNSDNNNEERYINILLNRTKLTKEEVIRIKAKEYEQFITLCKGMTFVETAVDIPHNYFNDAIQYFLKNLNKNEVNV